MVEKHQNGFIGYDYREIRVKEENTSLVIDGYANFGWLIDDNQGPHLVTPSNNQSRVTLKFKRDRIIRNKAELTRLQRQFDATVEEIEKLEKSKELSATIAAITVGIIGTAFIAGSVFAVDAGAIGLMILLAIPGFLGWISPYFIFRKLKDRKGQIIDPIIEQKYDEIYEITKQGNSLLKG